MAFAEFGFAVVEQLGERAVDVAEAEEAEVVGWDAVLALGLKPG